MKFLEYLKNAIELEETKNTFGRVRLPGLGRSGMYMPPRSTPGAGFKGKKPLKIDEPEDDIDDKVSTDPKVLAIQQALANFNKSAEELRKKTKKG